MLSKYSKDHTGDWRKYALLGYGTIFFTFVVAGGWSAVAKVDRAVVASGYITVETNRKTIQHLEGGIVREVLVKEGQHVKQGQVIIKLENTQAQATSSVMNNQLMSLLAMEARLVAERDHKDKITWPAEFANYSSDPALSKLIEDQERQFVERKQTLDSQLQQLQMQLNGITIERESTEKQLVYLNKELENMRRLQKKELMSANRVLTQERGQTQLEGNIGKLIANAAAAEIQIGQIKQKFAEDVASNLLDVRSKINESRPKNVVAADVLRRVDVVAPRAGTIQNLKVFTLGQVIRPGEPMLDIVPDDERLVVQAQFSPIDIDVVHQGQRAEIRFPAFHSRTIPVMMGNIDTLSQDRLVDEASKQPYYLGTISISKSDIPEEWRARLRPGMPAEIIVAAGERTVLNYLVSPLSSAIRKTFIEQ